MLGVKGAAALSQVLIAAGSLSAVVYLLNKMNPCQPERPLIDYEAAVLMLPALLLGVLLGESDTEGRRHCCRDVPH